MTTNDSRHALSRYSNLAIDLALTGLNQLWTADITYVRLPQAFAYLAAILDAFMQPQGDWQGAVLLDRHDADRASVRLGVDDTGRAGGFGTPLWSRRPILGDGRCQAASAARCRDQRIRGRGTLTSAKPEAFLCTLTN